MKKWQFQLFNVFFIVFYQNLLLVLITLPALSALDHRRVVAVPGLSNKIGAFMPRLTPRPVMRRVVHYIQREV